MRRRSKTNVWATMALTAGMLFAAGCGNENVTSENAGTQTQGEVETQAKQAESEQTQEKETVHTVTFYDSDGTTVLSTEEVADGETVTESVPQKDGYTFAGWYATPNMSHRFDFTAGITEDTSVFAGFVSQVEDTRSFAIVGSGSSPVLMESNWGKVIGDAQTMTKEDSADANIYTITLDLEPGDEFQFAINSSWNCQRGYGYLDTISYDGTDYFANSGGLGDTSTKRSNIKCAVSGNYTFYLTTYPGEDSYETDNANYSEENKEAFNINAYDSISWTYNGESTASDQEKQVDYYIKGAQITGWEDVYSDETKFVENNGIYTLTVELTDGDEFMFTSMVTVGDTSSVGTEYIRYTNIAEDDSESLSFVTGTDSANLVAGQTGSYTFTYDPATQVLTVDCK